MTYRPIHECLRASIFLCIFVLLCLPRCAARNRSIRHCTVCSNVRQFCEPQTNLSFSTKKTVCCHCIASLWVPHDWPQIHFYLYQVLRSTRAPAYIAIRHGKTLQNIHILTEYKYVQINKYLAFHQLITLIIFTLNQERKPNKLNVYIKQQKPPVHFTSVCLSYLHHSRRTPPTPIIVVPMLVIMQ